MFKEFTEQLANPLSRGLQSFSSTRGNRIHPPNLPIDKLLFGLQQAFLLKAMHERVQGRFTIFCAPSRVEVSSPCDEDHLRLRYEQPRLTTCVVQRLLRLPS